MSRLHIFCLAEPKFIWMREKKKPIVGYIAGLGFRSEIKHLLNLISKTKKKKKTQI